MKGEAEFHTGTTGSWARTVDAVVTPPLAMQSSAYPSKTPPPAPSNP